MRTRKESVTTFGGAVLAAAIAAVSAHAVSEADSYPIVDTGQTSTYDDSMAIPAPSAGGAFYGQDAQFDGNQPSYALSGDGLTVYDNVTGLTWQPGLVASKFTYSEALTYVDTMNAANYGGYSDWRLPSIKELYSLIDFRGTDPPPEGTNTAGLVPFIDNDYFGFRYGDTSAGERIIDSQWVSSTVYIANSAMVFGVNFADGRIKGYGMSMPGPGGSDKTFEVRLVRGNTDYGVNVFTDNGDGTVTDSATGLMWSQNDSGADMDWETALAWVEARNTEDYLGYNDWRLPNAKEMQSILDYSRSPDTTGSAAIAQVFNTSAILNLGGALDYPFFWTGTTHLSGDGSGSRGVYVCFGRGLGTFDGSTLEDVHGAGCQRSDPKTGNRGDYPAVGSGPQGDVQRVFNYVRLVRDAGDEEPVATDDRDGDGLTNDQETMDLDPVTPGVQNPFDPDDPDSTGDNGVVGPDGILDACNDWDSDGMSNFQEFRYGYDPLDGSSYTELPAFSRVGLSLLLVGLGLALWVRERRAAQDRRR